MNRRRFIALSAALPAATLPLGRTPPAKCSCPARGAYVYHDPEGVVRCLRCDAPYDGAYPAFRAIPAPEDS